MTLQKYMPILATFATILLVSLFAFLVKLYRARVKIARLRNQGLPMPPWHPILGHLYFCYQISSTLPKDAHPNYLPDMIRRKLPDLGPIYYLDTWPFGPQMLVVSSTRGLYQITQEHSLPKYPALKYFLQPIAEGLDLVTMEGNLWKTWRGIFNPGFSAGYLMSLTKSIVAETETFCGILERLSQEHAVFRMKDLTDNLTMDIIGRIVMNAELGSQMHSNPLVDGLRMQVKWLTFGADVNPITRYNPLRPIVHWYNSWRMNDYVTRIIDSRFTELQSEEGTVDKGNKSIIDLVLTAYLSGNAARKSPAMDSTFKRFTMSQIKLFLFSGHDTTSSTVCYIFYILATNPVVLARVRAEHVSVLGPDASKFASVIASDPFLLNELPYTIAVIKEVLRMFPAVSGTRAGEPNFHVTDDLGRRFPTDGFLVWDNPQVIHRDPIYWRKPDDFIPDRWLVAPGDPLHPVKGAWRPFSHGPRNCIGQELAMNEMKIMMVMTAQRFDIGLAYEYLDRTKGTKAITTVNGERGYQIGRAQPSDDLPCRVAENSG
ncbi:hypothetical protein N7G274_005434 [Stereocaulon virgatum]|uniref:Cytochrome P450 n=1 Tax=Stereocaulon virgatum TaxID=373712 RepID=A0ABR4A842_9LECA